jgi:hypothetical protein
MAGPFSRGDTLINKTFTLTFFKAIIFTYTGDGREIFDKELADDHFAKPDSE